MAMTLQESGVGRDEAAILEAARTVGALNTSAGTAPRILAALCDPAVTAIQVAQLVNQEPGLAGRVLRVANSAFYGLARTVSTVDRAVVVLGLDAVRGVAAAACLERALPHAATDASPVNPAALLRHSVATAAAAEALARHARRALAGEAFIAGLLHDFGLMVQMRIDPSGVHGMLSVLGSDPGAELRQLERQRVSIGHERCAAVVFESWNLPESIVMAARHHHDPLSAPDHCRALSALVHAADQLSLAQGFGFPLEPAAQPDCSAVWGLLGLGAEQVEAVAAGLVARTEALQSALTGA